MTQNDFLNELRDAKSAHVKWHAHAQALSMGLEAGNEKVPQLYTNCTFGKWYYGAGQFISNIQGYQEIEPLHMELHKIYIEIYQSYILPAKKGLFTNKSKAEKKKQENLDLMVTNLHNISKTLLNKITELEKAILAINNDDFVRSFITPN